MNKNVCYTDHAIPNLFLIGFLLCGEEGGEEGVLLRFIREVVD